MRKPLPDIIEQARGLEDEIDLYGRTFVGEQRGFFRLAFRDEEGRVLWTKIIASPGDAPDFPWEHVSVSAYDRKAKRDRTPPWNVMCRVKELFWADDETVMQLHPPKAEYVNDHLHCLHLWRPTHVEIPRPPSILVGDGSLERAREAAGQGLLAQAIGKLQSRKEHTR